MGAQNNRFFFSSSTLEKTYLTDKVKKKYLICQKHKYFYKIDRVTK